MHDFITWCLVYAKHCEANDEFYRKVDKQRSTVSYEKWPESVYVTLRDEQENHLCKIILRSGARKPFYAISLEYGHFITKPDKELHSMFMEAINHAGL